MTVTNSIIIRHFETLLWITGVVCLTTAGTMYMRSAFAQSQALQAVEQWHVAGDTRPDQSLWSPQRRRAYEKVIAGRRQDNPIAALEVSTLGLRVAVFEGTTDRILNLGAGRVKGTAPVGSNGNIAIAAHRDGYFRGLKDITTGDRIRVEHPHGVDQYVVTELQIVSPNDVSVLAPGELPTLTLITCYPFYFVGNAPQRFIVQAELETRQNSLSIK